MKKFICADCGHEQDSMTNCEDCGSVRVVLFDCLLPHLESNWRSICFPKDKFPKAWEQPGWDE